MEYLKIVILNAARLHYEQSHEIDVKLIKAWVSKFQVLSCVARLQYKQNLKINLNLISILSSHISKH